MLATKGYVEQMGIPILMYHSLDDGGSPISVSPGLFERQMQTLHQSGVNVISFGQLVRSINNGESLPGKSAVLTFDDGFENVYQHGFPVLQKYGFPATVFLVAGYCGKTNDWPSQPPGIPRLPLMNWEQISEMDNSGIEFGAHTHNHPRLDRVCRSELELEVVNSKLAIEHRLGHQIDLFSYPYGRFDQASSALVAENYLGACTTRLGTVSGRSDPLALERVDAYYVRQPQLFRHLTSPLLSKYLAVRRPLRTVASAVLSREWK